MSEFDALPLITFKTRSNTELGARSITAQEDGSIVFHEVLKKVTESMLTSYPRTQLGSWTPNRAALRYLRDEIVERDPRNFETGESLGLDALLSLTK